MLRDKQRALLLLRLRLRRIVSDRRPSSDVRVARRWFLGNDLKFGVPDLSGGTKRYAMQRTLRADVLQGQLK